MNLILTYYNHDEQITCIFEIHLNFTGISKLKTQKKLKNHMDFRIKRKKNCLITQNSISSFNGFSEAQTRSSHWRKAYHFRTHRYYNLGPELLVVWLTVERAVKRQQ
jgi:hypothetical protein